MVLLPVAYNREGGIGRVSFLYLELLSHNTEKALWYSSRYFSHLIRDLLHKPNRVEFVNGEDLLEPLTVHEAEILQLVAQGLANKQVALALSISEHTVKFHLSSLYAKFGVTSRTDAIHEGMQRGLIVIQHKKKRVNDGY
ncbi:response regulator transcription factor [Chloroflexota bacterium]